MKHLYRATLADCPLPSFHPPTYIAIASSFGTRASFNLTTLLGTQFTAYKTASDPPSVDQPIPYQHFLIPSLLQSAPSFSNNGRRNSSSHRLIAARRTRRKVLAIVRNKESEREKCFATWIPKKGSRPCKADNCFGRWREGESLIKFVAGKLPAFQHVYLCYCVAEEKIKNWETRCMKASDFAKSYEEILNRKGCRLQVETPEDLVDVEPVPKLPQFSAWERFRKKKEGEAAE
ncbi:hypothetical protein AC578_5483 [Pseudocercospora eumusae]|uniref:Uncharacterized protein n=1 Tax=Pseudocercospora eumusae TaxID=321146 RepID=A0A139H1A7_9PEZI|nr:hypothetical protein AC578_5483 [Pseudocercospora eumusae]